MTANEGVNDLRVCAEVIEELDDSEGTTMGSAPASPCLWQTMERTEDGRNDYGDDRNDESDDDGNGHGKKNRVSLDAFFRGPSSVPRTTQSPQPDGRLSQARSVVVKDTSLCELDQSPAASSLWSFLPPASQLPAVPASQSPSPDAVQSVLPKFAPSRLTETRSFTPSQELPAKPRALVLSPMSQLNVLSQISEMADLQATTPTPKPKISNQQDASSEQPHIWAPALKLNNKKRQVDSTAISKPSLSAKTPRRKTPRLAPPHSEALLKDMLDWETCSGNELIVLSKKDSALSICSNLCFRLCDAEEDLFGDSDEEEQERWTFEDISDSDFE
ncbi:hypothetical protein FI667_g5095, partial [Globisporangium splendens]